MAIKFNKVKANNLNCSISSTLESLSACISENMPLSNSEGYTVPTAQERSDWRVVTRQMLGGLCDFSLPASLGDKLSVRTYVDSDNKRNYCVLMETSDSDNDGFVDRGCVKLP